ncbi:hypothetical protein JCM9140_1302 [Halalkalibacter wakoensis JCM 9140]|uniref:Uncharacterized protein n=1 Tax=Halalkalibacter wakoensis JCM 9140 TaxID=1236970 RepID=W4Q040_9BACI|nr:hypothetical protein [Halalkalibacter wakoensis]GAE25315.1 hypothetical protein JCM9140_1302 [Halalkalibacter wakoensis JCM 9140]
MKKLNVKNIMSEEGRFVAILEETVEESFAKTLKDGGRMLVDSDDLAFVYIIEDDSTLYYVCFSQPTWVTLNEIVSKEETLSLQLHENIHIQLESIVTELAFLTENIEGNSNYGEEMERAVEEVFHS